MKPLTYPARSKKNDGRLFFLLAAGVFGLLAGCQPRIDEAFTHQVLHLAKLQTENPEAEAYRELLHRAAAASEQQADTLEKQGLHHKKIATKYLESAWLRSTIQANLKDFVTPGLPDRENPALRPLVPTAPDPAQLSDYQNALRYLLLSLDFFYTDETLFFNAGLCAAHIGKYHLLVTDTPTGLKWYKKARQYYERAIELDENYIDALYSLSILLVYELHEPEQAIDYLIRIKEHERYNTDARFLLAYTYCITGEYKKALREYEELEKLTQKPELQEQARHNREQILEQLNSLNP